MSMHPDLDRKEFKQAEEHRKLNATVYWIFLVISFFGIVTLVSWAVYGSAQL